MRVRFLSGFLAIAALASNTSLRGANQKGRESEIQALVADEVDLHGPGVAILVSRDGVPLHMAGYGLADIKAGTPITPDSLFDLASVSKHMTAVAILILAEKGRLRLNQPAKDYLGDFAAPVKGRAVTVADLLHHLSGLAAYTSDDWNGSDEEFATLTPETHLKWLNRTRPRRAPGIRYEYNNSGYVLLALIVERLSHQSFAQFVHDRLFAPAGMDHTVILDGTAKLPERTVTGYATRDDGRVKRSSMPTVITGDGNVYTSIRDLSLWDKALRKHTIISKEIQELAWTNGRYDNGKPIRGEDGDGYGFGWVIDRKRHTVYHSGSWNGTASYLLLDLQSGFTVAVLSNDEKTDVGSLAQEILNLFNSDQEAANPE